MQLGRTKGRLVIGRSRRLLVARLLIAGLLVPRWLIPRLLKPWLVIAGLLRGLATLRPILRTCVTSLRTIFGSRTGIILLQALLVRGEFIAGEANPVIGVILGLFVTHYKPFRNICLLS